MSKVKYRSRNHMLLLYPEDATHVKAMDIIKESYEYLAIKHDKDIIDADDIKDDANAEIGKPKKEHWHVIVSFDNARWNTSLAKDLGITENYIREVQKLDNAMQYLLHYNDNNKAQYDIDEVFGTFKDKLEDSIEKKQLTEGEKVSDMIDAIISSDKRWTVTEFAKYCAVNGYWAEFRRSGAIFCKIIEEHNNFVQQEQLVEAGKKINKFD